jgi:hypothetical protein
VERDVGWQYPDFGLVVLLEVAQVLELGAQDFDAADRSV